jgi:hypothetical protein
LPAQLPAAIANAPLDSFRWNQRNDITIAGALPLLHDCVGYLHGRRDVMPGWPNLLQRQKPLSAAKCSRIWYEVFLFAQPKALSRVCKLLPDVERNDTTLDKFTKYTIGTMYASYAAAQHRFCQHTQLLELLYSSAMGGSVSFKSSSQTAVVEHVASKQPRPCCSTSSVTFGHLRPCPLLHLLVVSFYAFK